MRNQQRVALLNVPSTRDLEDEPLALITWGTDVQYFLAVLREHLPAITHFPTTVIEYNGQKRL